MCSARRSSRASIRTGASRSAEGYHQDYLIHNPDAPYIVYNDLPKIAAFKRLYAGLYRETPVMVGERS